MKNRCFWIGFDPEIENLLRLRSTYRAQKFDPWFGWLKIKPTAERMIYRFDDYFGSTRVPFNTGHIAELSKYLDRGLTVQEIYEFDLTLLEKEAPMYLIIKYQGLTQREKIAVIYLTEIYLTSVADEEEDNRT